MCLPITSESGSSWISRTFHRTKSVVQDVNGAVDSGYVLLVFVHVDVDVIVVAVMVADVSVEDESFQRLQ